MNRNFKLILIPILIFSFIEISSFFLRSGNQNEYESRYSNTQIDHSKIRIVCIGESTTDGAYPRFLQTALDKKWPGKYQVFDFGKTSVTTFYFKENIDRILKLTRPHYVISMLGINDTFELSRNNDQNNSWYSKLLTYRIFLLIKDLSNNDLEEQAIRLLSVGREGEALRLIAIKKLFTSKLKQNTYSTLIDYYSNVRKDLTKALELSNEAYDYYQNDNIRMDRLWVLLDLKDEQAVKAELDYFKMASNDFNDDLGVFYSQGLENNDEAFAYFEKASKTNSLDHQSKSLYARLLIKKGMIKEANEILAYEGHVNPIRSIEESRFTNYTQSNLKSIYERILDSGSKLYLLNYPLRPIAPQVHLFKDLEITGYIENINNFNLLIKQRGRDNIFTDYFAGDFGHVGDLGNQAIVEQIMKALFTKTKESNVTF